MLNCYNKNHSDKATPIYCVVQNQYEAWLERQNAEIKTWLGALHFAANPGEFCVVPNSRNEFQMVVMGVADDQDVIQVGSLSRCLPEGDYRFAMECDERLMTLATTAWGLGAYQFTQYKKPKNYAAKLCVDESVDFKTLLSVVEAVYLIRDLVNTPPHDMNTHQLAAKVQEVAEANGAKFSQIVGEELLTENYPMIYAVGKGSVAEPHLLDFRWGNPKHPKVTLVGKGVCFDTGGLNLKPAEGMRFMKKDMAGAAHVLGLAQIIMQQKLQINLRVLIPAVENSISGSAYHPGDILKSRKGLTVEVTNTDAEGRLILADALTEAASESPELIIDIATLTGAARAALGTDLSAMFTDDDAVAQGLLKHASNEADHMWRMPLYKPYRKLNVSCVADLANAVLIPNTGGAITAALFLQEFVGQTSWVHFDIMAWNPFPKPFCVDGAEANAVRAIFAYLRERYE